MGQRVQAFKDLLNRYTHVCRFAWRARGEMDGAPLRREEAEFLPAVLALRDTPMHPAPKVTLWTLMTLMALIVLWTVLGKVDMVASAPGKIVPRGDVKAIQSQDTAVVTAIHVKDGQHVQAGDALLDLDATDATTDAARSQSDLLAARGEAARGRAMLDAIDHRHAPVLIPVAGLGPTQVALERRVLQGEYNDFHEKVLQATADIAQRDASRHETQQEIRKLQQTLPLEERKKADYAELIKKGYVGLHDYYNEQQACIQMEQDLAVQMAKLNETKAALDAAVSQRATYVADTRRSWLEKIQGDDQKAASLTQDLIKAQQHRRLMHLVAPVNGTVQQLVVHTVGGVVTPAQTVMTVVPDADALQVEAIVDNQDIGFIRDGQVATVKIETFPYTRYGTIVGKVVQVANDAKQDDKLGLIFTAQIALSTDSMQVDGRVMHLTPGMAVTAEIKTGRRRVISYLLSPLIQHATESMHER